VTDSNPNVSVGTTPYQGWSEAVRTAGAAKKRKNSRGRRKPITTPPLSITSLTDAVTLLLVYLLKTFATNPIEVKDSSIELPRSICRPEAGSGERERKDGVPPRDGCGEVMETTIVMVTGPKMKRTVNGNPVVVENVPRIAVNSEPIVELDPATYRVPVAQHDPDSNGWVITPLREALKRAKELKEVGAMRDGKKFDGKVIILADKETPYRVLSEVLVTCGESGFADFRFAVIKPD
jgi:biopolymer transport protein ExbD